MYVCVHALCLCVHVYVCVCACVCASPAERPVHAEALPVEDTLHLVLFRHVLVGTVLAADALGAIAAHYTHTNKKAPYESAGGVARPQAGFC